MWLFGSCGFLVLMVFWLLWIVGNGSESCGGSVRLALVVVWLLWLFGSCGFVVLVLVLFLWLFGSCVFFALFCELLVLFCEFLGLSSGCLFFWWRSFL